MRMQRVVMDGQDGEIQGEQFKTCLMRTICAAVCHKQVGLNDHIVMCFCNPLHRDRMSMELCRIELNNS
ncbi:hypothetical protein AQUCO_08500018v1 [Aquilegia coerulea]|uniref:Uncharacterized protein n=1 Tax=Aquilegia coerulea TaxID=218851 RepID=A0A2G5C818_AQUCA|nr:hypothetical protein AQUCO_08500018v1 [Aquilegia coerulea]